MARKLSRRDLLKSLGLATVGAALGACQPKVETIEKIVTQVVKETQIVQGTPQVIERVVEVTSTPPPAETPEIWFARTTACTQGANPEMMKLVQDKILDEVGVKVNLQPLPQGAGATEKLNLLLASGSQPLDLFVGNWTDFKGAILPMDDLLEQYGQAVLAGHPDYDWAMMKDFEGTTWGYPRLGAMSHTHYTYIRKDWLDEVGMLDDVEWTTDPVPMITSHVTWDWLKEAMGKIREAHDDAVVFTQGRSHLMMNTMGAFTEYGRSLWVDPNDGKVSPTELQPDFIDWLKEIRDWWDRGWIHRENFASVDVRGLLKTLTVAIWWGWYSRMSIWWEQIRQQAGYTDIDYLMVKWLEGPKGLARTNNTGSKSAYMIPRKSKHPEAVIKWANWVYELGPDGDPTRYMWLHYGPEGKQWEWVDKDARVARNLMPDVEACEEKYNGELDAFLGLGPESWYANVRWEDPETGEAKMPRHQATIYYFDTEAMDTGKMPVDATIPWDTNLIQKKVPALDDLNRLLSEEVTKFLSGGRDVTQAEYDAFVQQLEDAGLGDWRDAYTEQYKLYKPGG